MTTEIQDCLLCRKHRGDFVIPGGVLYADEWVLAYHAHWNEDQPGQYLGWVTVETRRHIPELWDLTDVEGEAVGRLVARLSRALHRVTGAEHVYSFVFGHGIAHVHLHLIPRYPGAPREFWGVRVDEWPGAPRGGAAEITTLCEQLKMALGEF